MALWLQNPQGKGFNFCFEKMHEFRRDRATIGPRSSHDRALIFVVVDRRLSSRSSGGDSAAEGARSSLDRNAIVVRSRFDRTARSRRSSRTLLPPSDGDRRDENPNRPDEDRTSPTRPCDASDRERSRPSTPDPRPVNEN